MFSFCFFSLLLVLLGEFAQCPNMSKVSLKDPVDYFYLLSSDKVTVTDANFVNDEISHCEVALEVW